MQVALFKAGDRKVEGERDGGAEHPADVPRPAHARKAHEGGEKEDEHDAQDEVGEGAHHKADIPVTAAHRRVRHDLDVDDEEEGRREADVFDAGLKGERRVLFAARHEEGDERGRRQHGDGDEAGGERRRDDEPPQEPLADAVELVRAEVLRNVVGEPRGAGVEAGRRKDEQLKTRSEARGDADAFRICELVEAHLDDEVAHRNKAVLQNDGNGEEKQRL